MAFLMTHRGGAWTSLEAYPDGSETGAGWSSSTTLDGWRVARVALAVASTFFFLLRRERRGECHRTEECVQYGDAPEREVEGCLVKADYFSDTNIIILTVL
jgi:hypothetical protein